MALNSKLNTVLFGEVSAMLIGLDDSQLESVKSFIVTLRSLNDVSVPTPAPTPAPAPAKSEPSTLTTSSKTTIKQSKVSTTKSAEPLANLVAQYADYTIANRLEKAEYLKVATSIGAVGKKGTSYKSCRGLISAVADGKVSVEDGKRAVAQFIKAQGWE